MAPSRKRHLIVSLAGVFLIIPVVSWSSNLSLAVALLWARDAPLWILGVCVDLPHPPSSHEVARKNNKKKIKKRDNTQCFQRRPVGSRDAEMRTDEPFALITAIKSSTLQLSPKINIVNVVTPGSI